MIWSGTASSASRRVDPPALPAAPAFPALSIPNRKEILIRPDVPLPVDERWGGKRPLADVVDVHQLKRWTVLHDERLPIVIGEEDLSVDRHRRRRKAFPPRDAEPACQSARPVAASKDVTMLAMSLTV